MSGCGSAVLPYAASATVASFVLSPLPQKTPPILSAQSTTCDAVGEELDRVINAGD